ncbi:GIY-YIG nuclease family protein [Salegentibacter sp. JZCK2]|uniref:GIY-YIG nuclease family protein n=1 Tax=Salegentibacter tibetensis TaxID=2873600 RepID=UPI001CCA66CF|nr:GIY-YIG nuclease family protein [Salegentibacter tibetensis]MBZ9729481.1 GIY-YIG nuclease family protein [Salegentibacter tibetensis]
MNNDYQYHVYIITNRKNGTLYIGMTGNLKQRLYQHKNRSLKSFSSRYRLNKLVYYEKFEYPSLAIKREKQLKKWNRLWKINLINDFNPDWEDLTIRFK